MNMSGTDFQVWPFRFRFVATDVVYFPPGQAANILRGAFGTIFRKLACVPGCQEPQSCSQVSSCPYARTFEPRQEWAGRGGPAGFADSPRPYRFRAPLQDGRFDPEQEFSFDIVLFEDPARALPYFVLAFREVGRIGIGPARGRARLTEVVDVASGESLFLNDRFRSSPLKGIRFEMQREAQLVNRLMVRFLTATELKSHGALVARPEFGVFFRRLRDRLSNLRAAYQGGPLDISFGDLAKKADEIRIAQCLLKQIDAERYSSRTEQSHPLGGFAGEVDYEGEFSFFLPYLRAGEWTGVGRQTVWGKGQFTLEER